MIEYKVEKLSNILEKFNKIKPPKYINPIGIRDIEKYLNELHEERLILESLVRERGIEIEATGTTDDWAIMLREGYVDPTEILNNQESLDNIAEELREEYSALMN